MKNLFLIYGTVICLVFAYATWMGLNYTDLFTTAAWGPKGQQTYHK